MRRGVIDVTIETWPKKQDLYERSVRIAEHLIETGDTVRKAAVVFGVSKSTVHRDISALKRRNPALYSSVSVVVGRNLAERHIRGGAATKAKRKG